MYKPLIEWARKRIEKSKGFSLPDLVDDALKKFRNDPEFVDAMARPATYTALQALVGITRTTAIEGREALGFSVGEDRQEDCTAGSWLEHCGKMHIRLTEMTRPLLRIAIKERTARHQGEGRRILFLQTVEAGLSNDETKVGQRYDLAALESMRRRIIEGAQPITRTENEPQTISPN